ncbi:branched-chain amino acid ABC transporter permease [Thalassospira alkalitolerans]|uniref:ABC transporter permease n=1 Tax=Thalassospira alkalitolerans TaxID=1293890 RepID=A0A1Y2LES3_9PROT|nr:branched-chain amino acid ABC transporter permease [Thalassospira alkalitolerans]OSQ49470.1 ABC transporter permease [Thalassospira alkalitolerans]
MNQKIDTRIPALPSGRRSSFLARYGIWIVVAIVLAGLPYVFSSGLALSTMCMMGTMIIFALSYNMLLGQTGLLSFGHAVFFGLGGFLTAWAMNAVVGTDSPLPLFLFPIIGGFTGLVFGVIFGAVSTRRSGTAFAMITLGIAELVSSSALILRHFFGGEEGITVDRTDMIHLFGLSFGPQIQVYYLIAVWCLISATAMYALTCTPFGRICNAVRDNAERVRFIGYNTQTVRFMAFSLSGLFAGIGGGLAAINFEIMNSAQMGVGESGAVILMTYIGGIGNFAGPIIGAVVVTYLQLMLSDITDVWQLYFGLLFIGMVMYAPNGLAGLLALQQPLLQTRQLHRVAPYYALALAPGLVAITGLSMVIEMTYQLSVKTAAGPAMEFFGVTFNANVPLPWIIAVVLFAAGVWLFLRAARLAGHVYSEAVTWRKMP